MYEYLIAIIILFRSTLVYMFSQYKLIFTSTTDSSTDIQNGYQFQWL